MNTIRQAWDDYRAIILPPKLSETGAVLLEAYRRAFYAGAESLLTMILRGGLEPPFAPPLDMAYISALSTELAAHKRDLAKGSV